MLDPQASWHPVHSKRLTLLKWLWSRACPLAKAEDSRAKACEREGALPPNVPLFKSRTETWTARHNTLNKSALWSCLYAFPSATFPLDLLDLSIRALTLHRTALARARRETLERVTSPLTSPKLHKSLQTAHPKHSETLQVGSCQPEQVQRFCRILPLSSTMNHLLVLAALYSRVAPDVVGEIQLGDTGFLSLTCHGTAPKVPYFRTQPRFGLYCWLQGGSKSCCRIHHLIIRVALRQNTRASLLYRVSGSELTLGPSRCPADRSKQDVPESNSGLSSPAQDQLEPNHPGSAMLREGLTHLIRSVVLLQYFRATSLNTRRLQPEEPMQCIMFTWLTSAHVDTVEGFRHLR